MVSTVIAVVAIAISLFSFSSPALANVIVDWNGYASASEEHTDGSGTFWNVGSAARLSASSNPATSPPAYSSVSVSIPTRNTVHFAARAFEDDTGAAAELAVTSSARFDLVSHTLPNGTPVQVRISLSLSGSLFAFAGTGGTASSSIELTSSLGPGFDQSVSAGGPLGAGRLPLNLTESAIITVVVGQLFSFDPTILFGVDAGGGGTDANAEGEAFGTLSFSAESLNPEATATDVVPEPSTLLLLLSGLVVSGLFYLPRRKKRSYCAQGIAPG